MIRPTINGTSRDGLLKPRRDAMDAITDAIEALKLVTPNGRDYPGDTARCIADREQHFERLFALRTIKDAIYAEAIAISNA